MKWGRDSGQHRGQSAIIGLVLLIGLVATVSVGIFLVAGETIDSAEQRTETERVEQSFVELSQTMLAAGTSSDTPQGVDLGLSGDEAIVLKNTSTLTIEQNEINETETINFGTIEYETSDGTKIAHQGGGVFAETENETRVVSAPPVSYVNNPNAETLSFPILEPTDNGTISSGELTARNTNTDVKFSNVIQEGNVTIKVQGPYYRGWETYFERQAGEDAIEEVNHEENYVRVLLTQNRLDSIYEYAVVGGEYIDPGNSGASGIDGPVLVGGDWDNIDDDQVEEVDNLELEPINDEIEAKVDEADEDDWDALSSGTVDHGQYFEDGDVTITDDFDLSDGDITVAVDGDIEIADDVTVESTPEEHQLKIYTTGSWEMDSNTFCVDECADEPGNGNNGKGNNGNNGKDADINASAVELFGTDEFVLELSGSAYGEGAVYAPGGEADFSGTPGWGGSIVVDDLSTDGGGNIDLTYDQELEGGPSTNAGGGIPEIVYLNVVQHDVDLSG